MAGGDAQPTHPDSGLGLPVQLPRRASAYDVYAPPGSSGLNAMAIAAAQQRASISAQGMYVQKYLLLDKKIISLRRIIRDFKLISRNVYIFLNLFSINLNIIIIRDIFLY